MNEAKTALYWFKGQGHLAKIDIETLEEHTYSSTITPSNHIRKIEVSKDESTLISLEIDFHTINLFDLKNDKRISKANFELKKRKENLFKKKS